LCIFNGHYIPDIFNNTNYTAVSGVVVTNLANIEVGNIMADFARFYFISKLDDAVAKIVDFLDILPQQMQH
jgi:hypothetical protein